MSNKEKNKKNCPPGQLDLFGQVKKMNTITPRTMQSPAEAGKIVGLENFQKTKMIDKFYEEVKKLTSHLE